jgi:hypothetical protein
LADSIALVVAAGFTITELGVIEICRAVRAGRRAFTSVWRTNQVSSALLSTCREKSTMRVHTHFSSLITVVLGLGFCSTGMAVPYASGVRNTGGDNWEFVLNEAADAVTVLRDGGNAVNLGAIAAGRHTFSMTGFSAFSIEVSKSSPATWTELAQSNNTNLFTKYFRPNSVAVNKSPASPFFGTVYVNNSVPSATASPVRQQGDGIYALTADLVGVDLVTKGAIANADDASLAKAPGGWDVTGTNSPYQMSLDAAGNLIVGDWSDESGGVKWASPDLTSGGVLLIHQDGVRPLLGNAPDGLSGPEVHGSIASKPYTTGSIGNGLTVYGMDEDFDIDKETLITADTGNHVWKWNVGNVTSDYNQPPDLVINVTPLSGPVTDPTAQSTDAARSNYLNLNVGVDAKAIFSPQHNKWYLTQNRNDGNQAGIMVVTADNVDGNNPTTNWSSIQWSIDNNLDGFTDDADTGTVPDNGKQDVFRGMGTPVLSNDGTKLYIHRRLVHNTTDVYIGTGSPLSGNILEIPLDANGIPDIQINDNGTPDNTADDILSNLRSITIASNDNNHGAHDITFDAAGNLYIGHNISERLQVFSPGGDWKATTTSSGTFTLAPLTAAGVLGDYNGNGVVDAADYVVWRDNPASLQNEGASPGVVNQADYDFWRSRFGATAGSGTLATVPEPGAILLTIAGMICLSAVRRLRIQR